MNKFNTGAVVPNFKPELSISNLKNSSYLSDFREKFFYAISQKFMQFRSNNLQTKFYELYSDRGLLISVLQRNSIGNREDLTLFMTALEVLTFDRNLVKALLVSESDEIKPLTQNLYQLITGTIKSLVINNPSVNIATVEELRRLEALAFHIQKIMESTDKPLFVSSVES